LLTLKNVNVFYGPFHVLWDLSLTVKKGEMVFLIGQNASGKTTTIKTIAGLLHPESGSIEYLGKRIDKLAPHNIAKLGISCILEGKRVFPYMSVLENLELAATTPEAVEMFHETLEEVYDLFPILKKREKQQAGTLSGGEQQMLAIARLMISRPKLCLLDEISLGLSPIVISELYKAIRELRSQGLTFLIVEQSLWRSLEMCDRAYILRRGHIVLEGNPDQIDEDEIKRAYFGY